MAHETSSDHTERAAVEMRLPAEGAYAAVLRTTAAALAARVDFTIEAIEDLRISIGEAIALVLTEADPGVDLECRFHLAAGEIRVELSAEAVDNPEVDRDSFAWQVLDTMAAQVRATGAEGRFTVSFAVHSQIAAPATGAGL